MGLCSMLAYIKAFEQKGSLSRHTCCDTGPPFLRIIRTCWTDILMFCQSTCTCRYTQSCWVSSSSCSFYMFIRSLSLIRLTVVFSFQNENLNVQFISMDRTKVKIYEKNILFMLFWKNSWVIWKQIKQFFN